MSMVDKPAQPIWAYGASYLKLFSGRNGRPYEGARRELKREAIRRSRRFSTVVIGEQLGELTFAVPATLPPEPTPLPRLHRGLHAFVRARRTA